ncbi:valine--tRNA ligase [Candidatus Nucleicultrix amoebiphila]|jgi:valyl-tRNA synthetase|uniref:Valine--tRNA ligase n=1 Tax=Candidatus Nucleicultrix amoebiphila FS5 TaxID=1414854 RepID=A0A1W6N4A9_9PROT|nr:valine--tRNA ligase [Candidatus Nucleicultrix amoebiphila]ARN84685.1 valyl-tRNA synthetase [Candidatus Nucleicultrix amoebiphila FS5]
MLSKTYQPQEIEAKIIDLWEKSDVFHFEDDPSKPPFTIIMPPPNVTGSLHLGHALTFTLQDILVRYKRMKGYSVLWQPGMDHAGITTQILVEKALEKEGLHRQDLGREKFVERVWAWKEEYGGMIFKQQRLLGFSPDWSRERFTMDPHASEVVIKIFVSLYREKLIYKDQRLVNWDPKLLTALSDLEVKNIETKGKLWYIRYPVVGSDEYITVATTRPETLFGDQAVAVHPNDERYHHLHGKFALLPLSNREIPIITDEYSDPEKGTGAVKITPAHDFNDFEVGKRNNLEPLNIFDMHACLNEKVPEEFQGLDRFVARKKVLEALTELGLLEKEEDVVHMVPHADRFSGDILEPRITEQWYVDAVTLAKDALETVKSGKTKIVPESWSSTYYHWLENIQPWCISRQLWWGHRIPAWYAPDGEIFVAHDSTEAHTLAKNHFGHEVFLVQDEDVLDTWFSSSLWPFLTLNWPEKNSVLERHYPSDVLVTGLDIIFFWVARMMMMGMHFMKKSPFKNIFLHAMVRDEKGHKMSKSKGNVIDPLDVVAKFGGDALRFTVAALTTPGRDIRLSESIVENNRNFATKLWNATRFSLQNQCALKDDYDPSTLNSPLNRWIVSEVATLNHAFENALDRYRFDEAASLLYHFVWRTFCDWYIEFSKPIFMGSAEQKEQEETRATTAWVLKIIYHMLNPFMPFITEELWQALSPQSEMLAKAQWPFNAHKTKQLIDENASSDIRWLITLISAIRTSRTELNVPPSTILPLHVRDASSQSLSRIDRFLALLQRLAFVRFDSSAPDEKLKGTIQCVVQEATYVLPIGDVLDVNKERARLENSLKDVIKDIQATENKLNNKEFVQKAPEDILEKNKARLSEGLEKKVKLESALANLS